MDTDLSELGPFAEPALLILVSLADGPKHGYAMMGDIERLSGTRLGPGTLYAALARLERRGLIEPLPAQERRRPYRLTAAGVPILQARLSGMRDFVDAGLRRLPSR